MDEHRLGNKPIYRKIWSEIGINLTAKIKWKYQWRRSPEKIVGVLVVLSYYC